MGLRSCALLLLLCAPQFIGWSQPAPPAFEAADVKANRSADIRMSVDFQPGGRFDARNVPLKILIALAYRVRPEAVTGGPGWLELDRYDVVAKASQATPPNELRRMVQTLLAERFKLAVHTDQKVLPAYALVVAKKGPKLQSSEAALTGAQRCTPADPIPGQKHVACAHMTMALFSDALQELAPRDLDVPVVDQTALSGAFDFSLAWTPGMVAVVEAPSDPAAGPSLFDALQQQLGLKLESRKLLRPVLVIDGIERTPTEN